ncbi:MAG: methyltransferase domain-containing protein [Deltaproteobacteria bacterium]|nr:methyltransferase domain-containing protein [Deltaproteobacteria bacterium]
MSCCPAPRTLEDAVEARYGALATSCCAGSLSCGSAFDISAPQRGEVLVDLGCGRGRDVIRAADRVGDKGAAIGVDRTDAMLAAARAAVPPYQRNVRFVRSDLASLDLPDAAADVVISNCTINHARDKEAVYREVHRVLRPGGRFVVSDVIAEQELPQAVREDPAAWAACYGGAVPEAEYLGAISRAGFARVDVVERSEPYEKGGVVVRSLTLRGFKQSPPVGEGGGST